ncbi:MAG: VWA domain-containing protein [Thermoguttaceae bacterium]
MRFPRPISAVILALLAMGLAAVRGPAAEPEKPAPSRRPPQASPGEKAKVSLFGIEGEGYKIVYVFDRSGSMGVEHNPLEALKTELIRSLQAFDSVHQFQIISYNERPRLFSPTGQPGRLVFGTDENKASAVEFLKSVVADGGTDHEAALMLAIKLRPDVIYWLSDGDDPKLTAKQLERIDRLGGGSIINTIEFGAGPQADTDDFMVKLARQSGGKHAYIDLTKTEEEKKSTAGKK